MITASLFGLLSNYGIFLLLAAALAALAVRNSLNSYNFLTGLSEQGVLVTAEILSFEVKYYTKSDLKRQRRVPVFTLRYVLDGREYTVDKDEYHLKSRDMQLLNEAGSAMIYCDRSNPERVEFARTVDERNTEVRKAACAAGGFLLILILAVIASM